MFIVAAPVCAGEIDDQQILLEIFRLRDHLALRIKDDAVAVEDQFVVAADLVDIDKRLPETFDLRRKKLEAKSMLADHERRSAGVDQNLRAGGVQIGDGVAVIEPARDQFFVVPQVFADREPRGQSVGADLDEISRFRRGPGSK